MRNARLFTRFGFLLSLASVGILFFTFLPVIRVEFGYVGKQVSDQLIRNKQTSGITPVDDMFGIVIPKLGANAKIISDVDPYNAQAYQKALSKGVAHARGTVYPGDVGNVFLFAHSSVDFYKALQFNSVFYLISKLEKGDEVVLYHNKQKYTYIVDKKMIVSSAAVEYLSSEVQGKLLTLMTCWPPGTTLKRMIVQASLQ